MISVAYRIGPIISISRATSDRDRGLRTKPIWRQKFSRALPRQRYCGLVGAATPPPQERAEKAMAIAAFQGKGASMWFFRTRADQSTPNDVQIKAFRHGGPSLSPTVPPAVLGRLAFTAQAVREHPAMLIRAPSSIPLSGLR